jgi:DNA polymerase
MSLAEIYDDYRTDPAFDHLRTEGIVLVPGEGSPRPRVLVVGEAPGASENTAKRPFVGASGKVLRSLIEDVAKLHQADYFITNTVKYRPAGNRTPDWKEIAASVPYLRREFIALGRPPVLVAVGAVPRAALDSNSVVRGGSLVNGGKRFDLGDGRTLVTMVHPAYALRNRNYRPEMEKHWEELGRWLRESQD